MDMFSTFWLFSASAPRTDAKEWGRSRVLSRSTQDSNLEPPDDNIIVQRCASTVVRCAIQLRQQTPRTVPNYGDA